MLSQEEKVAPQHCRFRKEIYEFRDPTDERNIKTFKLKIGIFEKRVNCVFLFYPIFIGRESTLY